MVDSLCQPWLQNINTQEGRHVESRKICMDIANFLALLGQQDLKENTVVVRDNSKTMEVSYQLK